MRSSIVKYALLSAISVMCLFSKAQEVQNASSGLQNNLPDARAHTGGIGGPVLGCHYVLLDSDDRTFTSQRLREAVVKEPEFARMGFALSKSLQLPDTQVHLGIIKDVVREPTVILQAWNTGSYTTTQESFSRPESDQEHVIATKVIAMLSKLCGGPRSAKLQHELAAEEIAERLRAFHRVRVISRTYLAPKQLVTEFGARKEFADWGINTSSAADVADVSVIVDHLPSISWRYELVDLKDGAVLDSNEVLAFQEERAASRIADSLILHLAEYRGLKQVRAVLANQNSQSVNSEPFGTWRVKEVLESSGSAEPASRDITLNLQTGKLIGSDSEGQSAFSIDLGGIVDVAFDDTAFVRLDNDPWNAGDGGDADGAVIAVALLLHQIKIPRYRVHIAWNEDRVTRIVSLQASKGELKRLFPKIAAIVNRQGIVSDIR